MGVLLGALFFLAALILAGAGVAIGVSAAQFVFQRTGSAWSIAAIPLSVALSVGVGLCVLWLRLFWIPAR